MKNDFTPGQLLEAVKSNIVSFRELISDIETSTEDDRLMANIDRLLLNIYVHSQEQTYLSKMQACRMIPADHIDTCKRYVAKAEELGFITFESDAKDGRRTNVVPTQELIDYVEERARRSLESAARIIEMAG